MKHQCAAVDFDYNSLYHAYAMYDIIIKGSVNSKLEQPTVSLKGPGEILSTNMIMLLFKRVFLIYLYLYTVSSEVCHESYIYIYWCCTDQQTGSDQ